MTAGRVADDVAEGSRAVTVRHSGPHVPRPVLVGAVALIAGAAGLALGLLLVGVVLRPAVPAEGSVDAGFARDMVVHHEQAVEMSVLVRDRTDDPDVRQLALDILLTQQHQAGQMTGWLAAWGLPPRSATPPMTWAGDHDHGSTPGPSMPGLVSDAEMARLADATDETADRLYLALMIPHHVGGVEMAELAVERADQPAVRTLAGAIVRAQEAELTLLREMLADRGGPPPGA